MGLSPATIAIIGPTGAGKTRVALDLATRLEHHHLPSIIIPLDGVIGLSDAPCISGATELERAGFPIHIVGSRSAGSRKMTPAEYGQELAAIVSDCHRRGSVVILEGCSLSISGVAINELIHNRPDAVAFGIRRDSQEIGYNALLESNALQRVANALAGHGLAYDRDPSSGVGVLSELVALDLKGILPHLLQSSDIAKPMCAFYSKWREIVERAKNVLHLNPLERQAIKDDFVAAVQGTVAVMLAIIAQQNETLPKLGDGAVTWITRQDGQTETEVCDLLWNLLTLRYRGIGSAATDLGGGSKYGTLSWGFLTRYTSPERLSSLTDTEVISDENAQAFAANYMSPDRWRESVETPRCAQVAFAAVSSGRLTCTQFASLLIKQAAREELPSEWRSAEIFEINSRSGLPEGVDIFASTIVSLTTERRRRLGDLIDQIPADERRFVLLPLPDYCTLPIGQDEDPTNPLTSLKYGPHYLLTVFPEYYRLNICVDRNGRRHIIVFSLSLLQAYANVLSHEPGFRFEPALDFMPDKQHDTEATRCTYPLVLRVPGDGACEIDGAVMGPLAQIYHDLPHLMRKLCLSRSVRGILSDCSIGLRAILPYLNVSPEESSSALQLAQRFRESDIRHIEGLQLGPDCPQMTPQMLHEWFRVRAAAEMDHQVKSVTRLLSLIQEGRIRVGDREFLELI